MIRSEPFLYIREDKKDVPVSAVQAADLVTHAGKHCHNFKVNPAHQTPPIETLKKMFDELKTPEDVEAYLLHQAIGQSFESARHGGYGVGAILATVRGQSMEIITRAQNTRIKKHRNEYIGHAEMRMVDEGTGHLQRTDIDHADDLAAVNLCPCPGCFNHLVDAHIPTVLIGTIDPKVGAAFLKGKYLDIAVGEAKAQVIQNRNLQYRFPEIADPDLRRILLTMSWEVFHATRKIVHKREHGGKLQE